MYGLTGSESLLASLSGELPPSFPGLHSGLMKLLRSKAADTGEVQSGPAESLGARGRRRLQLAAASARERLECS